jgi:hypothetical protein
MKSPKPGLIESTRIVSETEQPKDALDVECQEAIWDLLNPDLTPGGGLLQCAMS